MVGRRDIENTAKFVKLRGGGNFLRARRDDRLDFDKRPEARHFVEKLRATANEPVVYAELPGAQHAFDVFPSVRTAHIIRAIERYVDYAFSRYRSGQKVDQGERGEVVA